MLTICMDAVYGDATRHIVKSGIPPGDVLVMYETHPGVGGIAYKKIGEAVIASDKGGVFEALLESAKPGHGNVVVYLQAFEHSTKVRLFSDSMIGVGLVTKEGLVSELKTLNIQKP